MTEEKKSAVEELKRQVFGETDANDGTDDDLNQVLATLEAGQFNAGEIPDAETFIKAVAKAKQREESDRMRYKQQENRMVSLIVSAACDDLGTQISAAIANIRREGTQGVKHPIAKFRLKFGDRITLADGRLCGSHRFPEIFRRIQEAMLGYRVAKKEITAVDGEKEVVIEVDLDL